MSNTAGEIVTRMLSNRYRNVTTIYRTANIKS